MYSFDSTRPSGVNDGSCPNLAALGLVENGAENQALAAGAVEGAGAEVVAAPCDVGEGELHAAATHMATATASAAPNAPRALRSPIRCLPVSELPCGQSLPEPFAGAGPPKQPRTGLAPSDLVLHLTRRRYRIAVRAVRGRENQAAEHAHAGQAATIRSTSARSAVRQSTQRRAHLGRDRHAAEPERRLRRRVEGEALRATRAARVALPRLGVGSRTSGTTASGKLAARPETAPAAPAARPALEQRLGADEHVEPLEEIRLETFSHGLSETFIPARFGARSRSRSITGSGIA